MDTTRSGSYRLTARYDDMTQHIIAKIHSLGTRARFVHRMETSEVRRIFGEEVLGENRLMTKEK